MSWIGMAAAKSGDEIDLAAFGRCFQQVIDQNLDPRLQFA